MDNPLKSVWGYLAEPRVITAFIILCYGMLAWAGASVLAEGATRPTHPPWGGRYEDVWAWMLTVGGLIGALSAPKGLWFAERSGIIMAGTALLAFSATMMRVHFDGAPGNQQVVVAVSLATVSLLATRWFRIRWATLDPTK